MQISVIDYKFSLYPVCEMPESETESQKDSLFVARKKVFSKIFQIFFLQTFKKLEPSREEGWGGYS